MRRNDDLDDDAYLTREVFAHFGGAVYFGQALEKALLTSAILAEALTSAQHTAAAFTASWDARWGRNERRPLSQVLDMFERAVKPGAGLLAELREALDLRNRLAHHYFLEHADDAESVPGRKAMLAELTQAQDRFEALIERVTQVTVTLLESAGGSRELLNASMERQLAAMRERVRARDEAQGDAV